MREKNIDNPSFGYWILKHIICKYPYRYYYRKIEVYNKKVIHRNESVIVAPNHQNALMDPMYFATHLPWRSVFLARADVFNKPRIAKFLRFIKILPIYRIRDGVKSLKLNEEVFETCVQVLLRKQAPLCMFPEGNHGPKRMLRGLVKGVFRIAFKAQADFGANEGVKIIPVGIDYKHFQKFRQTLLVNYGEPIEVSEYWKQYEENPVDATNALREKLSEEMKKLMIHIETDEYYDVYMGLRGLYNTHMRRKMGIKGKTLLDKFNADKEMIHKLDDTLSKEPEKIEILSNDFRKYAELRDKLNLRDWVFNKERYSVLINIFNFLFGALISPSTIIGVIFNWPHLFIPPKFTGKLKDPQFTSTVKWGIGTALMIVYYFIAAICIIILIPNIWLKLACIVIMPLSGIWIFSVRKIFIKARARLRYTLLLKKNRDLTEAKKHRDKVLDMMEVILG